MGVFSEIAMEQQNGMFDSSAAFEDDEAFELEEMGSVSAITHNARLSLISVSML